MDRGEIAIASPPAMLPLGAVSPPPLPAPRWCPPPPPTRACAAGSEREHKPPPPPPYPAPHQLYGNTGGAFFTKSRDARRKTRPISINHGSAYGNSIPTAPRIERAERFRPCNQFFARGSCLYGARCKYSHERPPMPPPTARAFLPAFGYPAPFPGTVVGAAYAAGSGEPPAPPYWMPLPPKTLATPAHSGRTPCSISPPPEQDDGYPSLVQQRSAPGTPSAKIVAKAKEQVLGGFKDAVLKPSAALAPDEPSHCPARNPEEKHSQSSERHDSSPSSIAVLATDGESEARGVAPVLHAKASVNETHPMRAAANASSATITRFGLSSQIDDFVEHLDTELAQLEEQQQAAVEQLQAAVRSLWPDSVVDVYGSNYTRLSLPRSDVDCVLTSRSLADTTPTAVLRQLAEAVRGRPWAKAVELLDCAKIPVLKVVCRAAAEGAQDVMLDLTCGHSPGHSGLSARDFVYSFQAEMPALRPLVLVLKTHLQRCGLNCAFTGGLSSYALVIMVIRFLQKAFNVESCTVSIRRRQDASSPLGASHVGVGELRATKWLFTFSRAGKVVWKTTIGSLLLLFLETYTTFDYRRFGISIERGGAFFHLPSDKVPLEPELPTPPYVADPIKTGRKIGNAFRMNEASERLLSGDCVVVQAWYALYQQLAAGASLASSV
ncbi:hypothetical protein PybrP1_003189 [[Pythium] brassicae (nom. inval.)]|nr:hypothetical protein PybrP1_003189 [[Pythium] brassicae (nom. inval.)]